MAASSPEPQLAERAYPLTVFYDGDCPICAREIRLLERLNRRHLVRFVDFADPAYDPRRTGLGRVELGRVIHARWADGAILVGLEVFREVWSAVGFGFLARLSRLPGVNRLLIRGYDWFARNRLWLTGRAAAGGRSFAGGARRITTPVCRAPGHAGSPGEDGDSPEQAVRAR